MAPSVRQTKTFRKLGWKSESFGLWRKTRLRIQMSDHGCYWVLQVLVLARIAAYTYQPCRAALLLQTQSRIPSLHACMPAHSYDKFDQPEDRVPGKHNHASKRICADGRTPLTPPTSQVETLLAAAPGLAAQRYTQVAC